MFFLESSVDNPCVNSLQDYFKTKKMEMTIKYIGSHLKLIMLAMYMVVKQLIGLLLTIFHLNWQILHT